MKNLFAKTVALKTLYLTTLCAFIFIMGTCAARADGAASPTGDVAVPFVSSAYDDMLVFAQRGCVTSLRPFDFRKGTVLTRKQMATALAEVIAVFGQRPDEFSPDDLKKLDWLTKEFQGELSSTGVDYMAVWKEIVLKQSAAPGKDGGTFQVAPWVYTAFLDLSNRGFIDKYPPFLFRGGKVFTRQEMALILTSLIDDLRLNRQKYLQGDVNTIVKLTEYFRPELDAMGYAYGDVLEGLKRARAGKKPVNAQFAVSPRLFVMESEAADFSTRIDSEIDREPLKTLWRGNFDKRTGAEKYELDTTEWALGYRGNLAGGEHPAELDAGSALSMDFGSGLVAGSARIQGYGFLIGRLDRISENGATDEKPEQTKSALTGYVGKSSEGTKIACGRLALTRKETMNAGIELAKVFLPGSADNSFLAGADFKYKSGGLNAAGEYVRKTRGDRGFYFNSLYRAGRGLELRGEYRNYLRASTDFSAAPVYSGATGGDANDETGFLLGANWIITDSLSLFVSRDIYENHEGTKKLANNYAGTRIVVNRNLQIMPGYEHESGSVPGATRKTLNIIQQLPRSMMLQLNYSADSLSGSRTDTYRGQFRFPPIKNKIRFTLNDTLRDTETGRDNTAQLQSNWNISPASNVSAGFTFPESGRSSCSVNLRKQF